MGMVIMFGAVVLIVALVGIFSLWKGIGSTRNPAAQFFMSILLVVCLLIVGYILYTGFIILTGSP